MEGRDVDRHGRAFVGSFGFDLFGGAPVAPTSVHRVDPDGTVTRVADDLWFPNGGGALWIADALAGRVLRVREGGEVLEEIVVGTGVFACMLGGHDGRTLFLCAAPDFDRAARSAAREAELRACRVDVPHAGRP